MEREDARIQQFEVPLLVAEARMTFVTNPQGKTPQAVVILEWCPAAYTGNTPGIQFDVLLTRMECLAFYRTLVKGARRSDGEWQKSLKQLITDGELRVAGKEYGRVKLMFGQAAGLLVFLTPEDCDTIAQQLLRALDYAAKQPRVIL